MRLKNAGCFLRGINGDTFNISALKNRAKIVGSYLSKQYEKTAIFPSLVHIELTNICNLRCVMCPNPLLTRKRGYMDGVLFEKIVRELSVSPAEMVVLSLNGESLLHREFPRFLSMAKSAGLKAILSTNGLSLSPDLSRAIIDNALDILNISYDSIDPEKYKNIRRGGELSLLNENIRSFLRLKAGRRLPLTVLQCIDFPRDKGETDKIRDYWKGFDVIVAGRSAHNWRGDIPEINRLTCAEREKKAAGICDQPWRHAVIYWDGRVGPCCSLYDAQVTLGNLYEHSLYDIWNGDAAANFRRQHVTLPRESIKECRVCRQKSPDLLEAFGLLLFDMTTINTYLLTTDGWRDYS